MRLAIAIVALLAGCTTPEQAWVSQQRERCAAMGGTGVYADGKFDCFRHPIGRFTRHLFTANFKPQQ